MSDHTQELMKKLEQRVNRRTFLKGSALAGAAIIGIAALPALTFAQSQQPQDQPKADDKDAKKDDKSDQGADKKDKPEEDEFKVTHKDNNGRDYRVCPQCGYNMYKQKKLWVCENCGYSYSE